MSVLPAGSPTTEEPSKRSPRYVPVVLAMLMLGHLILLGDGIHKNFVTFDEAMHIPAGISHWKTGDFSMYRVNPPLPRMIAVLPVMSAGPVTSGIIPWNAPGVRSETSSARAFSMENAGQYRELVSRARLAGIGWSLLGGYLVFRWARQLYGDDSGLLAAALWYLGPNVLAHAQIATPDVPAAVAGLGACYVFWLYLKSPSWSLAWAVGVFLGVAQLTKFTWVVLYIVWPVLAVLYRFGRPDSACRAGNRQTLAMQGCAIVLVSLMIINIGYQCDHSFTPIKQYSLISKPLFPGLTSHLNWKDGPLGSLPVPLPAEYVKGIDHQRHEFDGVYRSYLRGEWRDRGWWYYYAYAVGVKVPIGYLALAFLAAGVTLVGRGGARWADEIVLMAPALAVFVLVSANTGINHHLRYILPAFPFATIATAKVARLADRKRRGRWLILGGLFGWGAISTIAIHPHYLSYFNEVGGGPEGGHAHLVDSNIDWGQDLLYLERWLDEHPEARPLKLAYYNSVDPEIRGIAYSLPPTRDDGGPVPGYYAVSVNFLRGAAAMASDGQGSMRGVHPRQYEYFRWLRPIARAGYSIYIYHVTPAEADSVRRRLAPWATPER